jgi:hypothetical protein
MKHSELLHVINHGVVISRFKIISLGNETEIAERLRTLNSFTGVITYKDQCYGIVPITDQREDHLAIHWDITPVIKIDGKWNRQVLSTDSVRSLFVEAIKLDVDLNEFLAKYSFEVYNGN